MADKENVVTAIKTTEGAPLLGAPAEYLDDGIREITYTLKFPFKIDGAEYRQLVAHKLTGKDIFAVSRAQREKPELSPETLMFAVMCKVDTRVIEALDAVDVTRLSKATAVFTRQLEDEDVEPTGQNGTNTSPK